jgi:hypothetical protein
MSSRVRYVYVCPACGCTSHVPRSAGPPGKFRETTSLVDGRSYPSCRQIERLCYWCDVEKYGLKEQDLLPLPKRTAVAGHSQSSTSRPLVAGLLTQYSEVWALLTASQDEDGNSRRTASLSLSCESGLLGLSLNDWETGQYCYLQGKSLDDLLTEAELRLSDGSMPWKPSKHAQRKK